MMENESNIDKIADGWLREMNLEEPSDKFSAKVMYSIYALQSEKANDNISYWWLLTLIPIMATGGWYLSTLPAFVAKITGNWTSIQNYYHYLNSGFGEMFSHVKSISISPLVILGFLAILSLLVIEDIFSKSRNTKLNPE